MSSSEQPQTERDQVFARLDEAIESGGATAVLDRLIATLETEGQLPQLFEALLMRRRHELGLPLQGSESLRDLPEELQETVEKYYIEVCRRVGGLFLEKGDIIGAWPYFRAIDEPAAVAQSIETWTPPQVENYDDPHAGDLDAVVDIAFNQGAHPRRGYELILSQYGTCRAITVFEHQFPHNQKVREECGRLLVRQLYGELLNSLRADIEGHDGSPPPEEHGVRELIAERPWLFEGHGYHIDVSHLQSVVRAASTLSSREEIDMGIQMCEYGRRLARDFQVSERAPFDDYYNDYRIFLRALRGEGVDGAVRYFTSKAERAGPDEDGNFFAAEVLVYLLQRVERHREAIDAYVKYLKNVPGPLSAAPSLAALCASAGDFSALLDVSRDKRDLLQYAAGLVQARGVAGAGGDPPDAGP